MSKVPQITINYIPPVIEPPKIPNVPNIPKMDISLPNLGNTGPQVGQPNWTESNPFFNPPVEQPKKAPVFGQPTIFTPSDTFKNIPNPTPNINRFDDKVAVNLLEGYLQDKNATIIDLSHSKTGNAAVEKIAYAISSGELPNLKQLNLHVTNIGREGISDLLKALDSIKAPKMSISLKAFDNAKAAVDWISTELKAVVKATPSVGQQINAIIEGAGVGLIGGLSACKGNVLCIGAATLVGATGNEFSLMYRSLTAEKDKPQIVYISNEPSSYKAWSNEDQVKEAKTLPNKEYFAKMRREDNIKKLEYETANRVFLEKQKQEIALKKQMQTEIAQKQKQQAIEDAVRLQAFNADTTPVRSMGLRHPETMQYVTISGNDSRRAYCAADYYAKGFVFESFHK